MRALGENFETAPGTRQLSIYMGGGKEGQMCSFFCTLVLARFRQISYYAIRVLVRVLVSCVDSCCYLLLLFVFIVIFICLFFVCCVWAEFAYVCVLVSTSIWRVLISCAFYRVSVRIRILLLSGRRSVVGACVGRLCGVLVFLFLFVFAFLFFASALRRFNPLIVSGT